jgi:large subunit ribosomal protein L29
MKVAELHNKSKVALLKELNELLKAMFGLRMQLANQQLSNTSQFKKMRRDIAHIKMVMNQKG